MATLLDFAVYTEAGAVVSGATARSLAMYHGSTRVLSLVEADFPIGDGPWTLTLPASATENKALGWRLLEVWGMTLAGAVETFTVDGFLSPYILRPSLRDADILERSPDLLRVAGSTATSFAAQRRQAWSRLLRELVRRGRDPGRILGGSLLIDLHYHLTCEEIGSWFLSSTNDLFWRDYRDDHRSRAEAVWGSDVLRYDSDSDGFPDEIRALETTPSVWTR